MIQTCASIAKFIRQSGLRTALMKKIAAENHVEYLVLPRYFEVRWSEFTSQLVTAVLKSWKCLVFFFSYSY